MFDPVRICRILNEEGVDFIVVGGMATVMHGSVLPTQDIAFRPSGPSADFESWRRHAVELQMEENLVVLVGSLDDIIESKRAADRAKDVAALPYLESLRDEIAD